MAKKDPAFLFYPGNWQGGTSTMTRHQKGCYIDLLIAQFNQGPLSIEEIRTVLGTDFAAWQGSLSKKFAVNEAGKYFNERLEDERQKRKDFSAKQSGRSKKRWGNTPPDDPGHPAGNPSISNSNNSLAVKNQKELLGDQYFHELVCMALRLPMPYVIEKLHVFTNEKLIGGELENTYQDCQRHFRNWLKIEIKKNPPQEKKLTTQHIIT